VLEGKILKLNKENVWAMKPDDRKKEEVAVWQKGERPRWSCLRSSNVGVRNRKDEREKYVKGNSKKKSEDGKTREKKKKRQGF